MNSIFCRRCLSTTTKVIKERKNTWKLPEVHNSTPNQPSFHYKPKKNVKFASVNSGTEVPENWRAMKNLPEWKRHKFALKEKFKDEAWRPKKKLSRETIDQIKVLNANYPELNTKVLSELFSMSPELMRRILKSSFKPSVEESERILARWKNRGERHLKYKMINQIADQFVQDKKLLLLEAEMDLEIEKPEELAKKVSKKLLGKEDILNL